jgi:hypothetical protein
MMHGLNISVLSHILHLKILNVLRTSYQMAHIIIAPCCLRPEHTERSVAHMEWTPQGCIENWQDCFYRPSMADE